MSASGLPRIPNRRLAWLFLAIPLCGLLLYLLTGLVRPEAEKAAFAFSFAKGSLDREFLEFSGVNPDRYVRWEREGLRITLPAAKGPSKPIGVEFRYPVRGDFEYSAVVEFLGLSSPRATLAIGANVYVNVDSPSNDGLWLGKMFDPKQGPIFHTGVRGNVPDKGRQTKLETKTPADALKGAARIRLMRKGGSFQMWAGDKADLKRIDESELGRGDVSMFRLAAEPGNSSDALVDIRLIEMSLTAQEFVDYVPKAKREKGR